jgi:hypothetical protein
VTPIALPVNAAISHYESSALPWERAAFIRARAAAGDQALGEHFLSSIEPFVWRRSLDFGAIGEIQSLTRRIRDHYAEGQGFGPGFDLKRGRGGIREVEFFVQIHQLIHGGRDPELRAAATIDAIAALAAAGLAAFALRDVLAPVRLAADGQGVTVVTGFAGRRRIPWSEIERIRVDVRQRIGRKSELLEIDTGETLHLLSAAELGADLDDVVATLVTLRTGR